MSADDTGRIPIINWLDEPIKKSIESVFDGLNRFTESLDLFNKYKRAHINSLKSSIERVKFLGMTQGISLDKIYYPTKVSTSIRRRLYKPTMTMQSTTEDGSEETEERPVDGEVYIENFDRVVVLGGPGSGKTTFLRHLALTYTDKHKFSKSKLKTSKFPIYIHLPNLSSSKKDLIQFIVDDLVAKTDKYAEDFVRRIMSSCKGSVIILLDSLDEVPSLEREDLLKKIVGFNELFPFAKTVLSCRIADYKGGLQNYNEVEIVKLDQTAIKIIINSWFPDERKKAKELHNRLKIDRGIAGLIETPLLLGLLCTQYKHDLSLPQRKSELYKRCINAFLIEWDASRQFRRTSAYSKLSDEIKVKIFEHVAGLFFGQAFSFPKPALLECIGAYIEKRGFDKELATDILKEIESHNGILVQDSIDTYCFSHPSFHEYFVARYFLEHRSELAIVKDKLSDETWSSVIEFLMTMSESPADMTDVLITRSIIGDTQKYPAVTSRTKVLWLLYRCLAAGMVFTLTERKRVITHIIDTQVAISKVYKKSGIIPILRLAKEGVEHSYYYFKKPRPTLSDALLPLRKLSDEILFSPIEMYADTVMDRFKDVKSFSGKYEEVGLFLSLIVPLATIRQKEVLMSLRGIRNILEANNNKNLTLMIKSTESSIESFFSQ